MKLLNVIRKELIERKKNLFIYALTIVLILLLQEFADAFIRRAVGNVIRNETTYLNNYSIFLFLGGFITTSVMFAQDMFSRTGQHNWLMLPASRFDKFLAKASLTTVGYPLALTALFAVASLLIEALALLFFQNPIHIFNPFTQHIGLLILHYMATQSLFLLGATYFRKAHFVKTVLSLLILSLAITALSALFVRIAFAPYSNGFYGYHFVLDQNLLSQHETLFTIAKWFGYIGYWIIMPVFCWFTAYLRVKEVEATDAIQ